MSASRIGAIYKACRPMSPSTFNRLSFSTFVILSGQVLGIMTLDVETNSSTGCLTLQNFNFSLFDMMKLSILLATSVAFVSARPTHLKPREVPQEHSHQQFLTYVPNLPN
jgi:hypothetical protein